MQSRDHHQRAIDRLADTYRDDPRFRGLIIGGSVAKGYARDDSDLCDYDGGFVDGKIINMAFREDAAERGNEPSRAAFEGAFAAYSHVPGLDDLLKRIPVYPETGHDEPPGHHATALFERVQDFQDWGVSDLDAYTWFMTNVEWSWMSGRTPMEDW